MGREEAGGEDEVLDFVEGVCGSNKRVGGGIGVRPGWGKGDFDASAEVDIEDVSEPVNDKIGGPEAAEVLKGIDFLSWGAGLVAGEKEGEWGEDGEGMGRGL